MQSCRALASGGFITFLMGQTQESDTLPVRDIYRCATRHRRYVLECHQTAKSYLTVRLVVHECTSDGVRVVRIGVFA
jgi:hypothetical protein